MEKMGTFPHKGYMLAKLTAEQIHRLAIEQSAIGVFGGMYYPDEESYAALLSMW